MHPLERLVLEMSVLDRIMQRQGYAIMWQGFGTGVLAHFENCVSLPAQNRGTEVLHVRLALFLSDAISILVTSVFDFKESEDYKLIKGHR